ncbi:hypothetical protein HY009_03200 [Candidatus Acetothermia bacterium]|nr:hypothetical protein [Candidatus Acetothermia bacterium]
MWREKVAAGCLLTLVSVLGLAWSALASPVNLMVTAYKDLIRFQAQGPVQELRVEILSLAGQKLVDSETVHGSVLEWRLGNNQRMLAANGVYLYAVTVKDASSQPSKYQGKLVILRGMVRVSQSPVIAALPITGSSVRSAQTGPIQLPDLTRSQNFIDEMPTKIHLAGPQKSAGKRHINEFDFETLILSGEFRDAINGDYRDKLVDLDGDHIADGVLHCSQTLLADPLLVDIFVDLLIGHDVEVLDAGFVDIDLLAFARRPQCEFEFLDDTFASKKSSHSLGFVKVKFTGTLTDSFHVSFDNIEGDFNDDGQDEVLACEADIRFTVRRSITVIIEIDTGDVVQVSGRGGTLALRARHRDVNCEII